MGWFAAIAAVAGAVLTERLARRDDGPAPAPTEQLAVAGVGALGAMVVAPLCMQPARAAELSGSVDPVWAVGICAVLGAVVGAGAAIAVLLKPPFGWNVAIIAGSVWLLALVSVAPSIGSSRPLATVRLGVLEPSWLGCGGGTTAGHAAAARARPARRRGGRRAGPPAGPGRRWSVARPGRPARCCVAFAYLTAGPGYATDRYQVAPYYGALIAVIAGALGSTAATLLPRPVTVTGDPDAVEATDILAPLPHSSTPVAPAAPPTPPVTSGAAAPAHWNWPEPGGSTTTSAPVGADLPAADRPAVPGLPTADQPAGDRPATVDRTTHGQPMPGLLPPGRRTSAIDVLAAGRPIPGSGAGPGADSGTDTAHADSTAGTAAGRGDAGPAQEPTATTPRVTRPRRTRAGRSTDGPVSPADASTAPRTADATSPGTTAGDASPATGGTTESHVPGPRTDGGDLAGPVPADADGTTAAVPPAESTAGTGRSARSRRGRTPKAGPRAAGPAAPDTAPADAAPADATPTTPAEQTDAMPTTPSRPAGTTPSNPAGTTPSNPAAARPDVPGGRTEAAPTATSARSGSTAVPPTVTGGPGRPAPDAANTAPIPPAADPARGDASAASTPGRVNSGTPDGSLGGPAPRTGSPAGEDASAGRTRSSFFFDDDPAPVPSSRPRFPMFEEVAGAPGEVRPAWPITRASRPQRVTAEPDAPTRDGAEATTPAEPAPRPRHRGLPEPGASAGWDALATNARPAGPVSRPEAKAALPVARPEPATAVPAEAGADTALPEASEPDLRRGRHAGPEDVDVPAGKTKTRRGLFRRNRPKADPEPADGTAEPDAAADDEYVDWVAGLASDDNADDSRSLRTGRHHRD